jgi:type VI secretion system protein ImpB
MAESTQHKLDRVRPPRVQITYDVEIGDAIQKKELPFVMGVISDLAGSPAEAPPPMKDRKFIMIDRDNFNDVMSAVGPRVAFQVANRLTEEDSKLNVELTFSSMDDFDPANLVQQVEPLRKLFEARQRLSDLRAKLDGNDELDRLLSEIVENTDGLKEIQDATAEPEEESGE